MRLFPYIALVLLVGYATPGRAMPYPADASLANDRLGKPFPYRGTYYDPRKGGTGIQVEIGTKGLAFITFFAYKPDGTQTFYIDQGTYTPSDEYTRWTTGVLGTVKDTPFYTATGGECIGDGCTYQHSTVQFTSIVPTFTWVSSREVLVTAGSQSWDMISINADTGSDGDYFNGHTWEFSLVDVENGATVANPVMVQTTVDNGGPVTVADPSLTPLTSSAQFYQIGCQSPRNNCLNALGFGDLVTSQNKASSCAPELWYDATIRKMGLDVVCTMLSGQRVIGPVNLHVDLYVQTPDYLMGRGMGEGNVGNARDHALTVAIYMARLKDGLVDNTIAL